MILWTLVIMLMLGFAVTQEQQTEQEQAQSAEQPVSGEELRTDGSAWTQAHAGNENLEDTKMVINQILHGGGGMPGFADQLTAEEIAAVATFEKTSWGNDFGEVSVEQVQKIMDDQETQQPQQQRQQQAGWYTEEQASSGAAWYQEHCAQCHGNNLAGVARNPALRGDAFLQDFGNVQALFNFIRTEMPFPHPGELAEQTYIDITAYILRQNGFPAGDQPLTADQPLQQLRLTPEAAQVAERSDPEKPAEIDEPKNVNPFTGDQAAIEEGRQLYFDYKCVGCHGAEGGGGIGASHSDNFWIYGAHDEAVFDVIRNGRIGMPPFENFEDDEIWKIIAFIRSLNQGSGEESSDSP